MKAIAKPTTEVSLFMPAARLAVAASVGVMLLLASLHILSPEFDPSWRMVSEYANGDSAWVLALMFIAWATSSWALAVAVAPQLSTRVGKVGLFFLGMAGIGEFMGALFDISHPLHGLAALLGIPSLPVAALLISRSLGRTREWSAGRKALFLTANLTWISLLLLAAAFAVMMITYAQAGGDLSGGAVSVLPPGVIAFVGWANRFLIVVYCVWVLTAARQALKLHNEEA